MESGLYVTFIDPAEPRDRELPAVGPLDHVVLDGDRLLAERVSVWQAPDMSVAIDRILEAEMELQRATGEEPGGVKRAAMRFTAREGIFIRFLVFSEVPERDALPELGPFAAVTVGPLSVDADGRQVASRTADAAAPWELTAVAGQIVAGAQKPDIAFRTPTGAYHGWLAAPPPAFAVRRESIVARPAAAPPPPAPASPPPAEPKFTPPPPRVEPAFTPPPRAETVVTPPPFELPPREPAPPPPEPGVQPRFVPPVTVEPLFKPAAEPVFKPAVETRAPAPPAPPLTEPPVLAASDLEHIERIDRERTEDTLRARIQGKERQRQNVGEPAVDASTNWAMHYRPQRANDEDSDNDVVVEEGAGGIGGLLWRLRFLIIGILVVGAGIYAFTVYRESTAPNTSPQFSFVNVGARFTGTRWDWVVNGTQRVPDSGKLKARGVFYLVRIGTTNIGTEGAQMTPGDFTLIDPNGVEHAALGLASGAYQGPDNPSSPNSWPPTFRVGTQVTFNLLFDIEPALGRGSVLAIADAPKTRVRLD